MADILYTNESHLVKLLIEIVEKFQIYTVKRRGRPYVYSASVIVRAFMVIVYFRLNSYRSLSRFLLNNQAFRVACGFTTEIPSYRTLSRRLQTLDSIVWSCAYQAISLLLKYHLVSFHFTATDSSLVEAMGRPSQKKAPNLEPTDHDAAWGWSKSRSFVWGYKLHVTSSVIVEGKTLIPIGWSVTPANVHDSHLFIPLMEKIKQISQKNHRRIYYSLADKGYDQKKQYEWCEKKQIRFVNPVRRFTTQAISPMKQWALRFFDSKKGKEIFRRRADIERLFGQLKDVFLIDPLPITGLASVSSYLSIVCLSYLCTVAYNHSHNRPLRAMKSVVA